VDKICATPNRPDFVNDSALTPALSLRKRAGVRGKQALVRE